MPGNTKPRLGFVQEKSETRLHVPHRLMPVIIVPGLMGTRLTDPLTGKLVWNPKGPPLGKSPKPFTVDTARLERPAPLDPDEKNGFESEVERDPRKNIRNFDHLIPDFYGELALSISKLSGGLFDQYGVRPAVYCCGYDWRHDNARAALLLARVVDQALAETCAKRVIIVAHSMGGLVARYYSRVLGGESKIDRMILVGSPSLGAPTAYFQVKNGISGINVQDLGKDIASVARTGSAGGIRGLVGAGADAATGAAQIAMGGSKEDALGQMYAAISLGNGKFMTKEEVIRFCRALTAMYQLMPTQAYSSLEKNWLVFDPLATGYVPTGYMLVLPTLVDSLKEGLAWTADQITASGANVGKSLKDAYESAVGGTTAERTSPRAWRNAETLQDFVVNKLAKAGGDVWDEEKSEFHFMSLHDMYDHTRKIYDRVDKTFVDCGHVESLYTDIYTGLLDKAALRPVTSAALALALRFHDSLFVDRGKPVKKSAWKLVSGLVTSLIRTAKLEAGKTVPAEEVERKPKVYFHPKTIIAYGTGHKHIPQAMLLLGEIVSKDDHNEIATRLQRGLANGDGDGTVPIDSANPPEELLMRPFMEVKAFPGVAHVPLTKHKDPLKFIGEKIEQAVVSFATDKEDPAPAKKRAPQ